MQHVSADANVDPLSSSEVSSDSEEESSKNIFDLLRAGAHSSAVRCVRRLALGGVEALEQADPTSGWTPLLAAAYYGSERVAAALLKAGVNVHATQPSTGETALHLACKWPHEKVVEVLLKHGANPNALNKRARSPAHTAAQFARRGNLELIISSGGDISLQDTDGNSPLHLAVKGSGPGPNEVVRLLLRAKCRLDQPNKAGQLPLHNVINIQALVIFAAMESLPDLMGALIKRGGVKLDVFDTSGMTPLQTASFKGDVEVARVLILGGAKVNFQASPSWVPCPSLAAADSLLAAGHGNNSNVKPLGDRSPLHFAAERGVIPVMELLLAHGAKVNNTSNEGLISPLHIAVWNQQAEAVRVLLAHKADVKARVSKNGMAPLHFACNARNAKLEIISMLLDAKADIEERCSDGLTPLMLAAQMAPADAVRLLLVRGARVQAKGRRSMTAVDCAEGRPDILSVLAQHCGALGLTEMAAKASQAAQRAMRRMPAALTMGEGSDGSRPALPGPTIPPASVSVTTDPAAGSLIGQLKQQLSSTSAQLYAWAAQNGGASAPSTSAAAPRLNMADADSHTIAQLLGQVGQMTLPASLADIGSSPLNNTTSTSQHVPLLDNGAPAGVAGEHSNGAGNMNALSEAVQMLSCITAIVTNQQGDAAAAGGTTQPTRSSSGGGSRRDGRPARKRSLTAGSTADATAAAVPAASTRATAPSKGNAAGATAAAGTSTAAAPAAAAATQPAPPAPQPPSPCALHQPRCLPRSLRACTCQLAAQTNGWVQAGEHQLQMTCTAGCKFCFHLPCWKVFRDQLKVARPGFPATFSQVQELMDCVGKDCQGTINQVCMVGPAGTQTLYQPPPKPATTIKAELVLRPAPLSATVPLQPVSTVQYTFVAEKQPSPSPAPAPVVLLPPSEASASSTAVPILTPAAAPRSDSPPVAAGSEAGADVHVMRRKRRVARESAPPPFGPESGEALQGRNPPAPAGAAEHGVAPQADFMRAGSGSGAAPSSSVLSAAGVMDSSAQPLVPSGGGSVQLLLPPDAKAGQDQATGNGSTDQNVLFVDVRH